VNTIDANRQAALMSLYYHAEAEYRPELTRPSELPEELKLMEPAAAVDWLANDRNTGYGPILRLALAELVGAPRAFANERADYVRLLAAPLNLELGDILLPTSPDDSEDQRANRFLQGYQWAAGLTGGCRVRNFRIRAVYQQHVSDVMTSIEVNRPVTDFEHGIDPRNWSETLKNVWDDSYEIDPGVPSDLDRQHQPRAMLTPSGTPCDIRLFEKADWSIALGSPFAYWRTILKVQIAKQLTGSDPSVKFNYRLVECLENSFFGRRNAGGIDVDHGHGACVAVDTAAPWSRLEASKVVRFTQPTLVLNDLTFVFLIIWFSALILFGACS
jgi:hypothetical protein